MAAQTAPAAPAKRFTPRQVLDKFYAAELAFTSAPANARSFDTFAAVLAPDFYMEQSSALPWAGEYHAPDGLRLWLERASEWVTIDVRNPEVFESSEGSDRVVVLSRIFYHCHKTGVDIDFPLSQTFAIDGEAGRIREIRSFYWDIRKLNEAMGYAAT